MKLKLRISTSPTRIIAGNKKIIADIR